MNGAFISTLPWEVYLVVVVFSVIQSLVGVGLLVFGTPILLLLDYSFIETLSILLPCSLMISILQIITSQKTIDRYLYSLPVYSGISIIIGLSISLFFLEPKSLNKLIGLMLIITGISRLFQTNEKKFALFFQKFDKPSLVVMGLIHGITNLGGVILTTIMSSFYREKYAVRSNIAFGYFVFCTFQLIVLLITQPLGIFKSTIYVMTLSIMTFVASNHFIFSTISDKKFKLFITLMIISCGVLLLFT